MNSDKLQKIKTLVHTSPLLNAQERNDWSALLELMNDKQILELEKIISYEPKPITPGQSVRDLNLKHIVNIPHPRTAPAKPPVQQKLPADEPKKPEKPVASPQEPSKPAVKPIVDAPAEKVAAQPLVVSNHVSVTTSRESRFAKWLKNVVSEKELPEKGTPDIKPQVAEKKPEVAPVLPPIQIVINNPGAGGPQNFEVKSGDQTIPVQIVQQPKPKEQAPVQPVAQQQPAAVQPKPQQPAPAPAPAAPAIQVLPVQMAPQPAAQPSPPIISAEDLKKEIQEKIKQQLKQMPAEAKKPEPIKKPDAPKVEPQKPAMPKKPITQAGSPKVEHKPIKNISGTVKPEEVQKTDISTLAKSGLTNIPTNFNIKDKKAGLIVPRPVGAVSSTFSHIGEHGEVLFKQLAELSGLSAEDFKKRGADSIAATLMAFVKTSGYHDALMSLEQSPLYKTYLDTGIELLRQSKTFGQMPSSLGEKILLNQKDFESFTDILRRAQALA